MSSTSGRCVFPSLHKEENEGSERRTATVSSTAAQRGGGSEEAGLHVRSGKI